jgi:small-conductance mechanosensitive channel
LALTRRTAERGFLLLLILAGGALLPEALSYRGGSQYFPTILLAALLACCLAALFRRRAVDAEDLEPFFLSAPRAGLALLLMGAYTLALPVVGYFTTSAILMFTMAWVFGYRDLRVILATIVGYLVFTWLVFTVIFERDMAREFFMPWIVGY